jgi:hypothetical protein
MIPGVNAIIISVDDAELLVDVMDHLLRCNCLMYDREPIDGFFDVHNQLRDCINTRKWLLVSEEDDD